MEQPKKSSVYTRTGDGGTSSLFNGTRSAKDEAVFNALGDVDELNANLGMAIEHCKISGNGLEAHLIPIQSILMDVGSSIATPLTSSTPEALERTKFDESHVSYLEKIIDTLDSTLPPLRNFILPSGGLSASQLHIARTVCRRAERSVVPLARAGFVPSSVAKFINRTAAMREKQVEVTYKKGEGKIH